MNRKVFKVFLAVLLVFSAAAVLAENMVMMPAPAPDIVFAEDVTQPKLSPQPTPSSVPEATIMPEITPTPQQTMEEGEVPEDDVVFDPQEEIGLEEVTLDADTQAALEYANELKNILLVGLDARPGEQTGRSDTIVIITLDTNNNVIKMTSLMRDLYVEIPGRKNNRINAAYVYGGADLLMRTIEENFGIEIDSYVAVNFSMLAELVDEIGGLDMHVESEYYMDRINAVIREDNRVLGIDLNDGMLTAWGDVHMTGKQVEAYARYRYGTRDGDFGRTARQREVLGKIFQKVSDMSLVELTALAINNMDNIYTNFSIQDVLALLPAVGAMRDAEIRELRIPVDGGYSSQTIAGMSVLVPNRNKTIAAITQFLAEE